MQITVAKRPSVAVIWKWLMLPDHLNERPPTVRRKKADVQGRVNRDTAIDYPEARITSYAGLELLIRYLRGIGLNAHLPQHLRAHTPLAISVCARVRKSVEPLAATIRIIARCPAIIPSVPIWPTADTRPRTPRAPQGRLTLRLHRNKQAEKQFRRISNALGKAA